MKLFNVKWWVFEDFFILFGKFVKIQSGKADYITIKLVGKAFTDKVYWDY